jgi:hypothetical protein
LGVVVRVLLLCGVVRGSYTPAVGTALFGDRSQALKDGVRVLRVEVELRTLRLVIVEALARMRNLRIVVPVIPACPLTLHIEGVEAAVKALGLASFSKVSWCWGITEEDRAIRGEVKVYGLFLLGTALNPVALLHSFTFVWDVGILRVALGLSIPLQCVLPFVLAVRFSFRMSLWSCEGAVHTFDRISLTLFAIAFTILPVRDRVTACGIPIPVPVGLLIFFVDGRQHI